MVDKYEVGVKDFSDRGDGIVESIRAANNIAVLDIRDYSDSADVVIARAVNDTDPDEVTEFIEGEDRPVVLLYHGGYGSFSSEGADASVVKTKKAVHSALEVLD